jgi:hypothetical protein
MSPLGWRDWESVGSLAGIRAFADVSACVRANRVEVLANGPSGRCHYTSSDLDGWEKWSDLGGMLTGPPTAVSWGPERLDVFVTSPDRRLYHRWRDGPTWPQEGVPEPNWGAPLAPEQVGRVSAVSWGVNRIDLFAKAAESGDCLHLFWDDTLGGWGPKRDGAAHWESLGGPLKTDPTGLTWGIKDRVDVFAVFEDGGLSHRVWEKGWQPWERLGDQLLSSRPSVVSWGDQRIDVVAHSAGDDILHIRFDPKLGGWRGPDGKFAWERLGTPGAGVVFKGAPVAVSWGPDRLDVFAQGSDNDLYWKAWRPGWSTWSTLEGHVGGDIAAVAPGGEALLVLADGRDEWGGSIHSRLGL